MIVRLPTLLVAAFAAFSSAAAAAPVALVDLGEITLDPNTGLRWLDVTSSVNRSYEDVTLNLVPGGDFYGYRYATAPEVAQLFTNAGIVTPWVGNQPGPGSSDYFELMNLIGMTRVTSDSWDTFGMTLERTIARLGIVGLCEIGPSDCYFVLPSTSGETDAHPWRGSFLIAVPGPLEISEAPLPTALSLFATGLGFLGYFGYRRRKALAAASAS